jgi:hypothetical protein
MLRGTGERGKVRLFFLGFAAGSAFEVRIDGASPRLVLTSSGGVFSIEAPRERLTLTSTSVHFVS